MYAVIETGGKQYRVSAGDVLRIERLEAEPGESIEFDRVLMVSSDDGGVRVGAPHVAGAIVVAKVLAQDKARKLLVFKYKAKKNYRRRYGHRQPFTEVRVLKIEA